MKRRTAFIHIGLAKTGTTAIQQSASSLEPEMARAGLRFLQTGRIRETSGQHCLAWRIRKDPRADLHCASYDLAETRAELAADRNSHIVVSSEEFSPLAYDTRRFVDLRALFDGYHLCGIVYVREQVEFFNSFFVELVKDLATGDAIGEFVQRLSVEPRYDYSNWMRPFAAAFDELIVRPYDSHEFVGGEIVKDFHHIIGFDCDGTSPNLIRNRSLSSLQVVALQHAVRRFQSRGLKLTSNLPIATKQRLMAIVKTPGMQSSGQYWGVPPEVTQKLRDHFRPLNRAFFKKYADTDYDFPNHQAPRRLNVARYADIPADIKDRITETVDTAALPS